MGSFPIKKEKKTSKTLQKKKPQKEEKQGKVGSEVVVVGGAGEAGDGHRGSACRGRVVGDIHRGVDRVALHYQPPPQRPASPSSASTTADL